MQSAGRLRQVVSRCAVRIPRRPENHPSARGERYCRHALGSTAQVLGVATLSEPRSRSVTSEESAMSVPKTKSPVPNEGGIVLFPGEGIDLISVAEAAMRSSVRREWGGKGTTGGDCHGWSPSLHLS